MVPIFGTGILLSILSILKSSEEDSFVVSNKMGGEFVLAFFACGVQFLPLEVVVSNEVDGELVFAIAGELL